MKKFFTLLLACISLSLSAQTFSITSPGCFTGTLNLVRNGSRNGKPYYITAAAHTIEHQGMGRHTSQVECYWFSTGNNWRIGTITFPSDPMYISASTGATPPTTTGAWINTECPGNLTTVTLPVELIAFAANTEGGNANLTWTTASEKGNAYFAIEHTTNGIDFREIAQVKGNGTTSQTSKYQYTHTTPSAGANYYRLRQVDADGSIAYSAVRFVSVGIKGTASLFPTVGQDDITLITDNTDATQNYEVYDMLGALVMSGTVQEQKTLNISTLSRGMYVVKISGNTLKFIKD